MTAALSDLIAQRDALARQIGEAQVAAKADAIAKVRQLMSEFGLTLADVTQTKPKAGARAGTVVKPKYREPASGQTWTGRGLKPRWLAAALASGKSIDDFRI